ncbi:MAG: NAD-dependent epimerase/dehydratase family protein [Deltaproteobacteria bacterium]|nr:NAD-dependent epimerase/dehydratase family protein [Deltaproteobacteria bacterium]
MRLLVTGGAGFIGSHVAETALRLGYEVAVIDNLLTGRKENVPAKAVFYQADIRYKDQIDWVYKEFQPEIVSHQAAQTSVAVSVREPVLDAEINIIGSLNVFNACLAGNVKRLIFASTGGAIYGEVPPGERASISWPAQPLSPYACSKLAIEGYLNCYHQQQGLDFRILRYANVYGPRQDPHGEAGVVAIFLGRLLAQQGVYVNAGRTVGDAGCIRDYVYVGDVVKANLAAMEDKINQPIINVGTGVETSTLELLHLIEQSIDLEAKIEFNPPRPGDLVRSVLDASEYTAIMGTTTDLGQGLKETAQWFREQTSRD